jgi:anaerobic magnesium-protoporphyrin IX monomethyl ester cyclase
MAERKSIKVALVNSPILEGASWHEIYLPINLAYLAAVLEEDGHEITVIDCPALHFDHEKLKAELASFEPDMIGISAMTPTIPSAFLSARAAKEVCPNTTVVLGGLHATFMDEQILNDEAAVDIVVRGEGEQTTLELARNSSDSNSLRKIDGITFRSNKQIIRTPDRPCIQNLDELPRPAYKYFPLDKYLLFGRRVLPVVTSRGCPFNCSFCVTPRMFHHTFRMRSPKSVVDELEWLRDVYKAEAFSFYDDMLTYDKQRIYEICDGIKSRKLNLPWDCQSRVDTVSREMLFKMREAGCEEIFFGVETGSQQILDTMGKKTSIEQNEKAIKWAKEAGIFVAISVVIGYPGETRDSIKQTLDFIRRVKPDDAFLCVATPSPGSELYTIIKNKGWKMASDWSLYDLSNPVFESPSLPAEEITKIRKEFCNSFYSPLYVFRQLLRRNSYSRIMARAALNHLLWRAKSTVTRRGKTSEQS